MDIGEVARLSGLAPSTLRYYEERGLIRSEGRNGLRRVFNDSVLERLALIALGRAAGFTLAEVGEMLSRSGAPHIDRARLAAKADELESTILKLTAMRDGLRHAVDCSAPDYMACPSFRRILRAAELGVIRAE